MKRKLNSIGLLAASCSVALFVVWFILLAIRYGTFQTSYSVVDGIANNFKGIFSSFFDLTFKDSLNTLLWKGLGWLVLFGGLILIISLIADTIRAKRKGRRVLSIIALALSLIPALDFVGNSGNYFHYINRFTNTNPNGFFAFALIAFIVLEVIIVALAVISSFFVSQEAMDDEPIQKHKFSFYVVKRMGMPKWKYWTIRVVGILLAFLAAGATCALLVPGSFGTFYEQMILGCFDPEDISSFIDLLISFSVILIISMALVPAFKMKFWNIGAEGQVLIGALVAGGIAKFMPNDLGDPAIWATAAVFAILAGIVWSVVPAIFKAFFNTNETLFTLMLNYIATVLTSMCISIWIKSGTQVFGILDQGVLPDIMDNSGFLAIPAAVIIFGALFFYIKMSKQGYELSVVGESLNTARYVGINVKKVIIRTMIITGAISGFLGFLLVCGVHQTLHANLVGGKGFTGVLIAWLGHFEPFEIALFSFLSAVFDRGTTTAATAIQISSAQFTAICTSIFFFIIIACEFFSSYQIKRHKKENNSNVAIKEGNK